MLLLGGQERLGGGEIVEPDALELLVRVGLGQLELLLHLGAPAQPPVDLDVAELGLHPVAAPQPPRDEREDEADPGDGAAEHLRPRRPARST